MRLQRKRNPRALLVGMQTGAATVENSMEFLQKTKMELPFDAVIPLLGLFPNKLETLIRKDICTPMLIAAQFTIDKIWKQPKCPSADEWIKKQWYIHTMEYYAVVKKDGILTICNSMNGLGEHYAK